MHYKIVTYLYWVVFSRSKIRIWKQITTRYRWCPPLSRCFQSVKDTNLKANHNSEWLWFILRLVVFSRSKIRIWKQITTLVQKTKKSRELFSVGQRYEFESKSQPLVSLLVGSFCCFQSVKDTNLKANHNGFWLFVRNRVVVFSRSKIRIWKQITTSVNGLSKNLLLFSVGQRYEFESKSQPFRKQM